MDQFTMTTTKKAAAKGKPAMAAKASKTSKSTPKTETAPFDKYYYYRRAVQAPDTDVEFLRDTYKELRGKLPTTLREDFCGTFAISCEWVKLNDKFRAFGIDLDSEPIEYGMNHYATELTPPQRERLQIRQENVLSPKLPKVDIVAAMNFSHFIFRDRKTMTAYFKNCYETLNDNGCLISDCFGGSQCYEGNEENTDHKDFIYYWHQENFDPVTNYADFHIHIKLKGKKKMEKCFSYPWRMWTIPELREMMMEAGFKKTHVYWEGTTKSGEGDGVFTRTEKGEECQAWIAYVVGEK